MAVAVALVWGCTTTQPIVRTLPEFRSGALNGKRIAFVRIAVSDDLGDERTGIVLSAKTRSVATRSACESVSRAWDVGRVVCLVPEEGEPASEILELERLHAKHRPIPHAVMRAVEAQAKSDYLLLFRPESVDTVQEISQNVGKNIYDQAAGGLQVSPIQTDNETELSYTVSAVLVDFGTLKPLRGALHSGSASRTVKNNLGFATAPPAAPLLAEIMAELGEALLDD